MFTRAVENFFFFYLFKSLIIHNTTTGLNINLFWGLSCRTSECNFHLSELKIHLPRFFVWYSLTRLSVPITDFSIKDKRRFKFYLSYRTSGVGISVVQQVLSVVQGSRTILNVRPCTSIRSCNYKLPAPRDTRCKSDCFYRNSRQTNRLNLQELSSDKSHKTDCHCGLLWAV